MIFVNDLWSISEIPQWLRHATKDQDMLGLADVVFPCFLFVVGMSIPFAIERRFSKGLSGVSTLGHILTRSLALLLMGVFLVNTEAGVSPTTGLTKTSYTILSIVGFLLVWNVYPRTENKNTKRLYTVLKGLGLLLLLYLAITFRDGKGGVFQAHWWGILGQIGWTYLICATIYLFTRNRLKYLIPIWLAFIALCILKAPMHDGSAILELPQENFLDQLIRILHIGNGALPVFVLGGVILSLALTKYAHISSGKKTAFTLSVALVVLAAGFVTNQLWIISKLQRTPPWVFFCIAISIGAYAVIAWLDQRGKAHWFNLIKTAGTATLTCYLMPYVVYSLMVIVGFRLPEWLTVGWLGILKCTVFAFAIVGITYLLGKLYIKLKI